MLVDAPLVLGGPNEELNPVDLLLASLASHAVFVCQHTARQEGIPLTDIQVSVQADFDPLGVIGEPVYPGFRFLKLRLDAAGPTHEQVDILARAVQTRCPIYATLSQIAALEVEVRIAELGI
jgi:uncharacterized OsmC-like protein